MRRLNLALLAALQLSSARARSFSVHDDLLAFPQFDVVFTDGWVSEQDAQALMKGETPEATISTDLSQSTQYGQSLEDSDEVAHREYKVMKLSSREYLCSIPVLRDPPPEDETATELAKAEEAKELSRATASGWELLGDLEGRCLYFASGWWTYRFCKNKEIIQYHAAAVNVPGQAPRRDPSTVEYILGAAPAIPLASSYNERKKSEENPLPAEVQVKGDQRYLVQRLEAGSVCDLTGRERTIEVQYHCVPGLSDAKIAWIKEVTICAYLMKVNTPRLCDDVAFAPPKEVKANPISCQPILGDEAPPPLLEQSKHRPGSTAEKDSEGQRVPDGQEPLQRVTTEPKMVGGIAVGARKVLSNGDEDGKPPIELTEPNSPLMDLMGDGDLAQLVAQAASRTKGGKTKVMSREELESLDVDPDLIDEMKTEVERLAGQAGWRIEIVDLPNEDREIRGYVDEGEEDEGDAGSKEGEGSKEGSEEKFHRDEL